MVEQEPNPTKWMDYGALIAGAALALWSRVRYPSEKKMKEIVKKCLRELHREEAIDRLLRDSDGD